MKGGRSQNYQPESKSSPIERFAQQHRLRIARDECNDAVVRGKHGDLSDAGDGRQLVACFWGQGFSRFRAGRIREALANKLGNRHAGGEGGDEAIFSFAPADDRASVFFLSALRITRKRRTTPALLAHLERMRTRAQTSKPSLRGPLQPSESPNRDSAELRQAARQ